MSRVLLDTNIIIHRENKRPSNASIGLLYRWLDDLKFLKMVHPLTIAEIEKYNSDLEYKKSIENKLSAYHQVYSAGEATQEFLGKITDYPQRTPNDIIDDQLLYEVYAGRVDILITEDRQIKKKSEKLGISDKVYSIDGFIDWATDTYPALVRDKVLNVQTVCFGNLDVNDEFFDSLRESYPEFNNWFNKHAEREAYVYKRDDGKILGFLCIKIEEENENYGDIFPVLPPKRRLKVATFKIESTGFRLGERFLKIIFENAKKSRVKEIYVTMHENVQALRQLFETFGFVEWGKKRGTELVLIKNMEQYYPDKSVVYNYPLIKPGCQKFIIPILPQFHTKLFPDSMLKTENRNNFLEEKACLYSLKKIYIMGKPPSIQGAKNGDLLLFYRVGDKFPKKYTSVLTTIGILSDIKTSFETEPQFIAACQNRTVFSREDIHKLWVENGGKVLLIEFLFRSSLHHRLPLNFLWQNKVIFKPNGPRAFTPITESQFAKIIKEAYGETRS